MKIDKMPADALAELHGIEPPPPAAPAPPPAPSPQTWRTCPLTPAEESLVRRLPKSDYTNYHALARAVANLGDTLDWERERAARLEADLQEAWRIYREDREESARLQQSANERALNAIETIRHEALVVLREQDAKIERLYAVIRTAASALDEARGAISAGLRDEIERVEDRIAREKKP